MVEDHVDYPGILLKILGIVGIIFGLAFGLPGILLLMHGGSWFFAIAGLMTVIAGWLIFRGEGRGVALYCAVCIFAVGWSIWDVRALDSWFWPLIPRLFAFGVALFAVLLLAPLIPQWRHDRGVRNGFLIAAAVVGLGLAATVAMMFRPHGVIRHDFAAAPNTAVSQVARDMGGEWHNYGRTLTATRFTPEDQINKDNIDQLQVAWTYQTGVYVEGTNSDQNTPAYANGTLYSCTPTNQIHALDPLTGQVKWVFDPDAYTAFSGRCRGLTYYEVAGTAGGVCTKRLAMTTIDARLFSIDADTGQPCQDFGTDGAVNMRDGMGYAAPGVYNSNSAPTVSHGKIVSGALVLDNYEVGEPSGVVRAWDAQTGQWPGPGMSERPNGAGRRRQRARFIPLIRRMSGPIWRSMKIAGSSICPPATPPRMSGWNIAATLMTNILIQSSRWISRPGASCGISARSTRICGITTCPRSRRFMIFPIPQRAR